MANFVKIEAEARERAGKGAARASRRAGKVPAVIYGAKQAATLIALDPRDVMRELVRGGWRSRVYQVNAGGEPSRTLMREVQFHPVTDKPLHVDFQRLAPGERIRLGPRAVAVDQEVPAISGERAGELRADAPCAAGDVSEALADIGEAVRDASRPQEATGRERIAIRLQ